LKRIANATSPERRLATNAMRGIDDGSIEITPAMVAAGAAAVEMYRDFWVDEIIAKAVYIAMNRVRNRGSD